MKPPKQRLDVLLVKKGLAQSRQRAQALILAGEVLVENEKLTKAGIQIHASANIRLTGRGIPYVSRGGLKLEAALREFNIEVNGLRCLDVGASTGGFTDCLLQHGAIKVTSVDVGYGQLHWDIRSDPRVHVLERTNIRYLRAEALDSAVDLACIDVSFISLRIVVPAVLRFVKNTGAIICLIKPQFEVQKGLVGKNGVVRDPTLHQRVLEELAETFYNLKLHQSGIIPSPILGPKGNQEYLTVLRFDGSGA